MKIKKSNNQYYGSYFEKAICSFINNEELKNDTGFNFTDDELKEMNNDAKKVADFLNGKSATHVGKNTIKEDCDIVVDDTKIELKYTNGSNGTYYNTSLSYFEKELGLDSYKSYMAECGVLDFLEKFFGEKVYKNISPVSATESKDFRHNNKEEYEKLVSIEKIARTKYINYIFEELKKDNKKLEKFVHDMITKSCSNKGMADKIIVFDHETKDMKELNKKEILSFANNDNITLSGFNLTFPNFRVTLGWQNGTGLNNPTIRIFLKN